MIIIKIFKTALTSFGKQAVKLPLILNTRFVSAGNFPPFENREHIENWLNKEQTIRWNFHFNFTKLNGLF